MSGGHKPLKAKNSKKLIFSKMGLSENKIYFPTAPFLLFQLFSFFRLISLHTSIFYAFSRIVVIKASHTPSI